MKSITLLQDFEWDLPADCKHWNRTAEDAEYFAKLGIPRHFKEIEIYDKSIIHLPRHILN